MKTPTIEVLDAAFSGHYESLTQQDRVEEATWFLDAIDDSELLQREIYKTIQAMDRFIDTRTGLFCLPGEDVAQLIMQVAAKFFFIGWNTRGAMEDDEKLRNLR